MTNRSLANSHQRSSIVELLLSSAVIGALVHFVYFQLAPIIWGQSEQFALEIFTPWTRPYALERDGIEIYAMYGAVLLQGALLIGLIHALRLLKSRNLRACFLFISTIISAAYFLSIGFHPPMSDYSERSWPQIIQQIYGILPGIVLVGMCFYLVRKHSGLTNAVAAIFLIPVCFISTGPAYLPDYGYIFAPALQILNTVSLSEIYFQYDLLLSLVAALTLHSSTAVELLQKVGQLTFYSLFFGVFIFSKQLFSDKRLSVPLLICIVLARVYAGEHHILTSFQVTPLRLDLWLILLVSAYFYGPSHWLTGATLSLLIFFHRNFGIIYFAAYCQLIALLLYLEYLDSKNTESGKYIQLRQLMAQYLLKYRVNLLLTLAAFACAATLLGGNGAYRYQNIGIGFLRIAYSSFFWYVALLLTATFTLLVSLRTCVSKEYFISGCFLIFLATGNSLYFFGRSHENNIINVSVIYIFALFLFIDLMQIQLSQSSSTKNGNYRNAAMTGSCIIVLLICAFYATSIGSKTMRQALNLGSGQFVYTNPFSKSVMEESIANIRRVTGDSKKVYFISSIDYLYYHHGDYKPVGYYSPFLSWALQDEMVAFLNNLIQNKYYIVIDNIDLIREAIPLLRHTNSASNGKYLILWK
jgi:hypothetical protein